jgi:hypothetical protein
VSVRISSNFLSQAQNQGGWWCREADRMSHVPSSSLPLSHCIMGSFICIYDHAFSCFSNVNNLQFLIMHQHSGALLHDTIELTGRDRDDRIPGDWALRRSSVLFNCYRESVNAWDICKRCGNRSDEKRVSDMIFAMRVGVRPDKTRSVKERDSGVAAARHHQLVVSESVGNADSKRVRKSTHSIVLPICTLHYTSYPGAV